MIRIALPDADVGRLEEVLRTTADPKLRHRVQIVLMAHRGRKHPAIAAEPIRQALADNPHLGWKRLPSYSPPLDPIERFWEVLRRRATPNRLFDTLADLRRSLRRSLSYFQTMRVRVRTLLNRQPRKRTPSAGS